jgi:hypothetical protein
MLENLIVPVLNRYDLLDRMIASIDYPIGHLLIVDNGASWVLEDMQIDVPACVEMTTYLPMPANLGWLRHGIWGSSRFRMLNAGFSRRMTWSLHPGALERLSEARTDEITLSKMFPNWQTFALGYEAVRRVGLFDEAFFPAFCEDNDYVSERSRRGYDPVNRYCRCFMRTVRQ